MNGPTPIQKRLLILKLRAKYPDLTVRAIAIRVGLNERTVGHILRVCEADTRRVTERKLIRVTSM